MDIPFLIPALLSIVTIGAVLGIAAWSKQKTEQRKNDPEAPKSSLAADGPNNRRAD